MNQQLDNEQQRLKTKILFTRVSEQDYARLKAEAKNDGRTLSSYIRGKLGLSPV